jgi:hypothetical protein
VIELLKRLFGLIGTEEVVDGAAREADKVAPEMGRKLLVTIVAASIGAMTTWAMTIDNRVYALQEALLLKQTILENKDQLDRLEKRIEEKALMTNENIKRIEKQLLKHLETDK